MLFLVYIRVCVGGVDKKFEVCAFVVLGADGRLIRLTVQRADLQVCVDGPIQLYCLVARGDRNALYIIVFVLEREYKDEEFRINRSRIRSHVRIGRHRPERRPFGRQ